MKAGPGARRGGGGGGWRVEGGGCRRPVHYATTRLHVSPRARHSLPLHFIPPATPPSLPPSLPARLPPPSGTTSHGSPVQRRTGAKYNREAPRLMSRPNKAKNRPLNNTRCNVGAAAKRGLARDARAERGMLLLFLFKISRDARREREREGGGLRVTNLPPPPRVRDAPLCIFWRVIRREDPTTRRRSKSRGIETRRESNATEVT